MHIPRGSVVARSRAPWGGVGSEEPGKRLFLLERGWGRGPPKPLRRGRGRRRRGWRLYALTDLPRPEPPCWSGRAESLGPMLRGCRLPGRGRDWPLLAWSSPFQAAPSPERKSLDQSAPPADALPSLCTTTRLQGPQRHSHGSGDSARSTYTPVCPSIYMSHRMYICWEHARFSVCHAPLSKGPCGEGGSSDAPFPTQPPPPGPLPAGLSACPSVSSALSTLR